MKFIRKFILNLISALMCIALFTCCGDYSQTPPTVTPPSSKTETEEKPVQGGTLRVPMNTSPATLHPLYVRQAQTSNLFSMIFEPLIAFDSNMEPTSCLAESWKYNEESNVWEFKLRSNVHWHGDMGEVTAKDAAFTVNSVLADSTSTYYASLSYYVESAESYGNTLVLHPKTNSYLLVYAMNIPIIPESYYSGKSSDTKDIPVGSGCFEAESLVLNGETRMTLVSFKKWWKKIPNIERVEAVGYDSTESIAKDFTSGNLDCFPTKLRTTEIYEILDGVNKKNYLSHNYMFLAFNVSKGICANADFRKGVAYGINRTDIINNVYLSKASGAEQPLYNDSSLTSSSVTMYDYNVSMAKETLSSLNLTDGNSNGIWEYNGSDINLSLAVINDTEDPVRLETAELIKKDLEQLGISVTVNALSEEDLKKTASTGNYDMILSGYYLSEVPIMKFAFSPDGSGNLSFYSSDRMNGALQNIDSANSFTLLKKAMSEFQNTLASDLPQLGLFFEMNTFLYRDGLHVENIRRETNVYESINNWYFTEA